MALFISGIWLMPLWSQVSALILRWIIVAIYGSHANGWDAGSSLSATFRSPWKSINTTSSPFFSRTSWKVGDGANVRFWRDMWCSASPLGDLFPGICRLSPFPEATVNTFMGKWLTAVLVTSVSYHPKENSMIMASVDGTIRVWKT